MKIYSAIFVLLLFTIHGNAQQREYKISFENGSDLNYTTRTGVADSTGFAIIVQTARNDLFAQGYLLANIDSIWSKDSLRAVIHVGKKYVWQSMGVKNVPEEFLSKAGYRTKDFNSIEFSSRNFSRLINRLLEQSSNNGYPFAEYQLKGIHIEGQKINATLNYAPGPVIYYDSLTLNPSNIVKPRFLESYLKLKEGNPFRYGDILAIRGGLEQLPFCSLSDSILLSFENNLCSITLPIKIEKSNKIDAIIGFLPNQSNGLRITGFVDLHIENLFKSGKSLGLIWQQFQNESQKLNLNYNNPNLLKSQLGFNLAFSLLKQDSTFLNNDFGIDAFYKQNQIEVSITTNLKSSRSLSNQQDSLALPAVIDNDLQLFGVNLIYNGIGRSTNPSRGWRLFGGIKTGAKQIYKSPLVSEVVYDSISLNQIQFEGSLGGEINFQLGGPFVLHTDFIISSLFNNNQLYANDLMRLGGVNSLRGFNDLELFVSSYGLARIEARLLFNKESRLFIFYDQGVTVNSVIDFRDTPAGFGTGIFLNTDAGNLQLIYALGVSSQQSLSLTQSKIHIGYVAKF